MVSEICAYAVVPCSAERARPRLPSRFSAAVGVNRWPSLHKRVRALVGPPHPYRHSSVSSLWWAPTGRLAALFPVLRAGVAITDIDETTCLLAVTGEYVPPLGRLGEVVDRVGLHRMATATVQDFTQRLARALAADVREGSR